MRLRNPFRRPAVVLKPNAEGEGHQVVSCRHEHYKKWRDVIRADTTTCGNWECSAHRGSIALWGYQCVQPGCGVTWRWTAGDRVPTVEWRERNGTESGGPPAPKIISKPDRRG